MSQKFETSLPDGGQVYVDPGVDPAKAAGVAAYAAGIHARRGSAALPKQQLPLQQPRPPIPVLSGGPVQGRGGAGTMADFARAERAFATQGAPAPMGPDSIIEEAAPVAPPPQQRRQVHTAASLGLVMGDILPEAATQDPSFQQGHGSHFAANQPHLAAKYGVMRQGQYIAPQRLLQAQSPKGQLSPQTVADLETLQRLQSGEGGPLPRENDTELRKQVDASAAGAAARVGNEPGDREVGTATDEERSAKLKRAIEQMDAFEFNQWRQLTMRQFLHSEDQREIIEKRLKPLDITDLLMTNRAEQRIPIIPGKYEVTLHSFDGQTELALKRLAMQESRSVDVGEQYMLDKHSFMSLAAGLHKVNDKPFPTIFDASGNFDDKLFLEKFNQVMKLPLHMLASIGINQMWFEMRVRKLYSATALGNG
jgi:hypothetical protein